MMSKYCDWVVSCLVVQSKSKIKDIRENIEIYYQRGQVFFDTRRTAQIFPKFEFGD